MIQESNLKAFFKKHLGWIVTGFLTLLLWMQTCNLQKKITEGKQEISQLQLDKQTLTAKVNDQGKIISGQKVIITDNTLSLNRLTDTIFSLRKKGAETLAYFRNVTKFNISHVRIPYLDSSRMRAFEDSLLASYPSLGGFINDSILIVPQSTSISDPSIEIDLTVEKNGVWIDSLRIPDTLDVRFLEHKGGLFKRASIEVQFKHSNPYIDNLSANSVFYKQKKKSFFTRVILPVAVGVGAGLLISR